MASDLRSYGRRTAPKGQESLAQGLPWVKQNKRFALKGLEMRMRSCSNVWNRFSPHLAAPFRANSGGELPRVNPGLCFLGHFGPRIGNLLLVPVLVLGVVVFILDVVLRPRLGIETFCQMEEG